MKRITCSLILTIMLVASGYSQLRQWSFEDAEAAAKHTPRPFVIFVHTEWCKYCHMMENITFKDQELNRLLNENFYFISFNAGQETHVIFRGSVFKYSATAKVHGLAAALAENPKSPVFPSVVVLDPDYSVIFREEQFILPAALKGILVEIADHH